VNDRYLAYLYRWLIALAALGSLIAVIATDTRRGLSFLAGSVALGLSILMWHGIVAATLSSGVQSRSWVNLLILLRYALIGGIIYAIMRLPGGSLRVAWLWFIAGFSILLPGLVVSNYFYSKRQHSEPP